MAIVGLVAETEFASPVCWALAVFWKDEPRAVSDPAPVRGLTQRFEERCRRAGTTCLADTLNLPPSRGVKRLFKPVPRLQDAVTSVWPSDGALRAALAETDEGGAHGTPIAAELSKRDHVVYWVPRRSIPTLAQAEERLARKQMLGSGVMLGSLHAPPPRPSEPPTRLDHPQAAEMFEHERRLRENPQLAALQYDRRQFRALANTANGDVQPGLLFRYHQENGNLWAFYEGDGVQLGSLVAQQTELGALLMAYQHVNPTDALRAGQCISYPEMLPDGRLRMHEFWRWTTGDASAGSSRIEECEGVTVERKLS